MQENTTNQLPEQPAIEHQNQQEPKDGRSRKKLFLIVGSVLVLIGIVIGGGIVATKNVKRIDTTSPSASLQKEQPDEKKELKFTVVESGKLVLPNGYADPTIAKTPAGYRMYVNRQSGGPSGYASFTSSDGVSWVLEHEMVISGVSTGRVAVFPDGVRIYYPGQQPIKASDPQADMLSSFSTNGETFVKDPGVRISPQSSAYYVEGPSVFQLPDKSWRMYFNENSVAAGNQRDGKIWGASSNDGLTFTRDEKPTLEFGAIEESQGTMKAAWPQVLHPFVVKNPKGGFIMFYNAHSELFAATSDDGTAWEKVGKIGIHGADADGFYQKDGTFRIFYGDFTPQTGGLVYSAVLRIE